MNKIYYCKKSNCNNTVSGINRRCPTCWGKTIRGKNNPSKRLKVRIKISQSKIIDGKCLKKYYCKQCKGNICLATALYGNKICRKCLYKRYRKTMRGKNNSNWKGGISKFPYPFEFNSELKRKIFERDNFICQLCYKYPCNNLV